MKMDHEEILFKIRSDHQTNVREYLKENGDLQSTFITNKSKLEEIQSNESKLTSELQSEVRNVDIVADD